ncbi:MAG TPA: hypothetical protein VGA61_21615 [Anaerolineae bacterium]
MKHRVSVVLAITLVLTALFASAALAADGTKQVGLVFAFPDGTKHAQIVTVPADATSYDALKAADIVLVSVTGQFGQQVCSINKVGCAATNCFCDSKHFWAFYHLDAATNKWVVSAEGPGSSKPANGAVEGWVWSGVDAKFNPTDQPPLMTFAQIQAQTGTAAQPSTAAKPTNLPATGGLELLALLAPAGALIGGGLFLVGRRRGAGRQA